jgi:peptidoglycan/LPS O-acetylase OafA/YrhL
MATPGPNRPEQGHVSINEHDVDVQRSYEVQGGRFLETGDEAGTAPEDRAFRPDIEGLRAVAVLLVLSAHLVIPDLPSGGIGVDVFFVISGFVITGILLRERVTTGRTGILAFYGRRARRIIPVAVVVIVIGCLVDRIHRGAVGAQSDLSNARWDALFLANYHPDLTFGTYWSLAVEEQFYLIYPALFILVALVGRRWPLRTKFGVFLTLVVVASYLYSGVASRVFPYGPSSLALTRAWELGVGGLLALSTSIFKKLPGSFAAVTTWVGLAGLLILLVSPIMTLPYPGWVAALPVAATALVIGGGTAAPRNGAESLLKLAPFKWLGRWSYSIYLWHLPIIILGIELLNRNTLITRMGLGVFAVIVSAGTYFAFENPIRHSRLLTQKPTLSVVMGLILIAACLGIVTLIEIT